PLRRPLFPYTTLFRSMGVAAAAIVLMLRNHGYPRWVKATLIFTLLIQSWLDLVSAHRLKPGHIVGFLVGLFLAVGLVRNVAKPRSEEHTSELQSRFDL